MIRLACACRGRTAVRFPANSSHMCCVELAGKGLATAGSVSFIQLSRERLSEKNVDATILKGNMGYDRYTVPDDCSCRTYFCCFPLALANIFPWPFVPILSNFSEEQWTQNHPQCLSGLSLALFPTTFLEMAVYGFCPVTDRRLCQADDPQ